jgi:protein SCO1/2
MRSTSRHSAVLVALLAALLVWTGCQGSSSTPTKQYPIKGRVVEVKATSVRLDHEAIPGYMGAMEMNFTVDNPDLLKGISAGDQVQGQLLIRSGEAVITQLNKN